MAKYYYGNQISAYGVENGYVDYACLSKSFDAVLNNDIMSKTYNIGYWEQESGMIDNQDEIDELQEQVDELESILYKLEDEDLEETEEYNNALNSKVELEEQIKDLQNEQDYPAEVYQWYIVDDNGARILKDIDEIVYYNEELDMYLWGVTHWGTSWSYVLTNIKIDW